MSEGARRDSMSGTAIGEDEADVDLCRRPPGNGRDADLDGPRSHGNRPGREGVVVRDAFGVDVRQEVALGQSRPFGWHVALDALLGIPGIRCGNVQRSILLVFLLVTSGTEQGARQTRRILFRGMGSEAASVRSRVATTALMADAAIYAGLPLLGPQLRWFSRRPFEQGSGRMAG